MFCSQVFSVDKTQIYCLCVYLTDIDIMLQQLDKTTDKRWTWSETWSQWGRSLWCNTTEGLKGAFYKTPLAEILRRILFNKTLCFPSGYIPKLFCFIQFKKRINTVIWVKQNELKSRRWTWKSSVAQDSCFSARSLFNKCAKYL